MRKVMLTTIDNPYDPLVQFDDWYAYDVHKGYNSCSLLARISQSTPDLSAEEQTDLTEAAIDKIVQLNPLGIYTKVVVES